MPATTLVPLLALAGLMGVHLLSHRLRFLSNTPRSRSLSFASGVSLAYVFLFLLPELAEGQDTLESHLGRFDLPLADFAIYLAALGGLLLFYALERSLQGDPTQGRDPDGDAEAAAGGAESHPLYWLHLGSYALYSVVVGYLLFQEPAAGAEEFPAVERAVFGLAMVLHFLVVDFGLRTDFPRGWVRAGRWVLSGATVAGAALGAGVVVSELALLALVAVLGGGVILNVLKEELPRERESRMGALLVGIASFAAVLAISDFA